MAGGFTYAGFKEVTDLIGDVDSPIYFNYIAYGTGTTAFDKTQTALTTETDRALASVSRITTISTDDTLRLKATFTIASDLTISEAGIFNVDTLGGAGEVMLYREVLDTPRDASTSDRWTIQFDIPISENT